MRIAIDGRWVFRDTGGVRRYTLCLVREILALNARHEILLITRAGMAEDPLAELVSGARSASLLSLSYDPLSLANQIRLPVALRRHRVDLYHSTFYLVPLLKLGGRWRTIVTLHDLIPVTHPDLTLRSRAGPFARPLIGRIARSADRVVTVSRHSAREIVRTFGLPEGKVEAIENGSALADWAGRLDTRWPPLRERLGLRAPFLLHVGRHHPSKNLVRLIEAFARLSAPPGLQLVLVGRPDPRHAEPYRRIAELGLEGRVVRAGTLEDPDLAALYERAEALVLPSLDEGFGLPAVEAMGLGCPVVAARAGALPEVVGEAGLLVDPASIESMAGGLARLLGDRELREALVARGRERARAFSWRKAAERFLELYEEVGRA
jgi:glycosyltransferase involved in cell wall biosynthesis